VSAWLRALVLAAAAAAFAIASGAENGALPAALAALAGAQAADALPRRARLAGVALAAACSWGALELAQRLSLDPHPVLHWGPQATLRASEALRWVAASAACVFALRSAARSSAPLAVAELVLAGAALALPFAAHRGGSLQRPRALADWTGMHGVDPALPFLLAGAIAAVALALLLLRPVHPARLALRIACTALVAAAAFALLRDSGARAPDAARALGLTGPAVEKGGSDDGAGAAAAPDFSALGSSSGDPAPVAVALLHGDWSPPQVVLYFRQSVLSQWNGGRLVRAIRADVDADVFGGFPHGSALRSRAPAPAGARVPLTTTLGLLVDHVQPFALDAPREIEAAANPAPERFVRAYRAHSAVPTRAWSELLGSRAGDPAWSSEQWRAYTRGPTDTRYGELAQQITRELRAEHARDPLARALAIKAWLERNATYRRDARPSGDGDPVTSFLFAERVGYCAHFAHAAVLLMRSFGLPARVAIGYALPDSARAGGSALLIRGADAHAWPELYLESAGWVPVDPSPRQAREALAPPLDLELQRRLAALLRRPAPQTPLPAPTPPAVTWREFLAALVLVLAASAVPGPWRRLAPRLARPRQRWRVTYRAALDRLAEVGLVRAYGETRERFAQRAAPLSPTFTALTRAHLRAVLGGDPSPRDGRSPLELYTEMRRELRARVPLRRRWLGRLDPWAWWRAR
jgi:hypothetical protein